MNYNYIMISASAASARLGYMKPRVNILISDSTRLGHARPEFGQARLGPVKTTWLPQVQAKIMPELGHARNFLLYK